MANADELREMILANPNPYMSQDFAVVLGLAKSQVSHREPRNEGDREFLFHCYAERNKREREEELDVFYSRFCALFLPACVDRALNPPTAPAFDDPDARLDFAVSNPWVDMLVYVQHTPYFAKYIRSMAPCAVSGRSLPRLFADRLLQHALRWDVLLQSNDATRRTHYLATVGNHGQLLSTLLTLRVKEANQDEVVPRTARVALMPILHGWSLRHRGTLLGDVAMRLVPQLSGEPGMSHHAQDVRRAQKNLATCGLAGCGAKSTATQKLRACAKCHTVAYCCKEHQQVDWASPFTPHKLYCFKTVY